MVNFSPLTQQTLNQQNSAMYAQNVSTRRDLVFISNLSASLSLSLYPTNSPSVPSLPLSVYLPNTAMRCTIHRHHHPLWQLYNYPKACSCILVSLILTYIYSLHIYVSMLPWSFAPNKLNYTERRKTSLPGLIC